MNESTWSKFHLRWARLKPPLRANAEVCAALKGLIFNCSERTLLLGVTPELSTLGLDTVAVDWSEKMLSFIWPGNSATRRAVGADWRAFPFASRSFTAVIGDGSLNCIKYPQDYPRVFRELARVLRPGAQIALRMYLTPEPCDSLDEVRDDTMAGRVDNIHALKWRLANAICATSREPNAELRHIHQIFSREFPDRPALAKATGWTLDQIAEIDAYEGSADTFNFPTARQLLDLVPDDFADPRLVPAGTYPLAARCPILVMNLRL